MKKKRESCKRAMLVLLFTLAATALLVGTAAAVTHTEVESVTRYAPAGPTADEEFEVTLRISYSELPLVVGIVETIPEGFSFVSTTCEHYQISGQKVAFAVIDETEITYRVKAPSSGDGTFTGEWVDLLVLTTELEEGKERWETIADTIVIVGGGGAGTIEEGVTATPTPTPFIPAVTKVTRVVPVMEAGKEVAMVFENMDVFMIAIKADKNVSDAKVVVERVEKSAEIPEPSGTGYIYLDIEVENAGDAKIEGRIEFKVANSWIADNSIDEATVTLSRYDKDEGWKALATSKTSEDADFVYFEAATPGFSTFAITGEKKEKEVEAAAATPTPATTATPSPTTPPSSEEVQGFEAAFAAVSLLIVYTMMFRKKGKGGDVK